jgi:hypothetical protein
VFASDPTRLRLLRARLRRESRMEEHPMHFERLVPYLLVDDVTEASRFYVDHLGFQPTA